jgi:hypothetical protein
VQQQQQPTTQVGSKVLGSKVVAEREVVLKM